MLFLPQLVPKTLEELSGRKNSEEELAKEEAALHAKLQAVRDYKRNTTPIGLPPKAPQAEGAVDEEDEDMTEEEEEEEEDEAIEEVEIDEEGESEDLEFEQ